MTIVFAVLADPHVALSVRRYNVQSLRVRRLWENLDVVRGLSEDLSSLFIPSSYDDAPLLAAAKFLKQRAGDLDRIVLLGDLATTGTDVDLNAAHEVFLSSAGAKHLTAKGDPRFGTLGVPFHVVPGNHDRYQDDYGLPGGVAFDRVFRDVYQPNNGVVAETLESDDVCIGLISADFCLGAHTGKRTTSDKIRHYGRGSVEGKVLGELKHQTENWQKENPNCPVFWAVHFSPAQKVKSSLKLEKKSDLIDLALELNVNHIFCGHTHERRREIGSTPQIYCAGSVSAVDSRGQHFLHLCFVENLNGRIEIDVEDYIYHEKGRVFVPSGTTIPA